jgi:gamma-glutamyltranspeptidase
MPTGQPIAFELAQPSGLSIGTPSLVAMLETGASRSMGKLPWSQIDASRRSGCRREGFVIGPRLSAQPRDLSRETIAVDPQRAIDLSRCERARRGRGDTG